MSSEKTWEFSDSSWLLHIISFKNPAGHYTLLSLPNSFITINNVFIFLKWTELNEFIAFRLSHDLEPSCQIKHIFIPFIIWAAKGLNWFFLWGSCQLRLIMICRTLYIEAKFKIHFWFKWMLIHMGSSDILFLKFLLINTHLNLNIFSWVDEQNRKCPILGKWRSYMGNGIWIVSVSNGTLTKIWNNGQGFLQLRNVKGLKLLLLNTKCIIKFLIFALPWFI